MKARDLIKLLETLDDDAEVLIKNHDHTSKDGLFKSDIDIEKAKVKKLRDDSPYYIFEGWDKDCKTYDEVHEVVYLW